MTGLYISLKLTCHLKSVHHRHHYVGDDYIGLHDMGYFKTLLAIGRQFYLE